MSTAAWLAIVGLIMVSAGIAMRWLWMPPVRGEHARYDPAYSVSAVATRIVCESARNRSVQPTATTKRL